MNRSNRFSDLSLFSWGFTLLAVLIGVLRASSFSFVNDDAFISFRYAKHFADGLGLVFNAGDRVEGYTNFLWTVFISIGMRGGIDPVHFSTIIGIAFSGLTILLTAILSRRLFPESKYLGFPIAALALSLHRDFNVYGTSGLETSMFTFLVLAGFAFLIVPEGSSFRYCVVGLLQVLSVMTRPDGIIFAFIAFVFLLLTSKERLRATAFFSAPFILIYIPYWLWRYSYYGFFFPNAFYAKSIDLPYYAQGWTYTWLFLKTYYVFALLPIIPVILFIKRKWKEDSTRVPRPPWWSQSDSEWPNRILYLSFAYIAAYTVFIIRIGGDFMFARFFIPILPLMYLLLEGMLRRLNGKLVALTLGVIVLAATFIRFDQFRDTSRIDFISDEWQWYPAGSLEQSRKNGATLKKYFAGQSVKVAFWAGQVKMIYYADPAVAIEASAGLTDAVISHQQLTERGRPGHEKHASLEYLLERKVNFLFGPFEAPPSQLVVNMVVFDSLVARIITYENDLMQNLKKVPGIQFVDIPAYLDQYIATLHTLPPSEVAQEYAQFKELYFDHNVDTVRERQFLEIIEQAPRHN